jgi:hypothetical protein
MRRSTALSLGAATVAVLDVAAAVEAFRTDRPVLAVLSLLAAAIAAALAVHARRPAVELRADLAAWTSRTAAATGDTETTIVNRAVARHRASLDGERGPDD